jgi:hypothetical protein
MVQERDSNSWRGPGLLPDAVQPQAAKINQQTALVAR